jgi:hypothetical protein
MTETNESEDWLAGGTIEASASNLTFFGGSTIPIDTSRLPDASDDDPDIA